MIDSNIPYDELLDSLAEGVYFTDANRKILYWNKAAERISGFSSAEVVGTHCWDNKLMHVDASGTSLCRGLCPLMKAVLTNTTLTTEAFLRHKDGYRVPVLIKTVPIRDVNGKPVGAVELFSDSSFRISIEERLKTLEKQALTDPLTGLSNRRHADAVLAAKFEELRRFGWKFGVVFVDIDGLKKINDELGHESGDHAIRLVARNLISNSRAFDVSARWGGEEFVIICENIQLGELREIAERMRSLIENSVLRVGERTLKITISIGATIVNESDSTETVVARADALMYESKMAGKNRASVRE